MATLIHTSRPTGTLERGSAAAEGQERSRNPLIILSLAALLGLTLPLYLYKLDARDLWSSHEGRAAQDAQSLLLDHAWGLPRLFSLQPDLQKPPLFYWLVALTSWGQGKVDAWSTRFPASASGILGVLLLFLYGCLCERPRLGFLAAVMLATSIHYTWLARVGRIDMPLTLAVTSSLLFADLGYRAWLREGGRAGWPWFAGSYVAIAAGLLLKGPIGLILPAAVLVLRLIVENLTTPRNERLSLAIVVRLSGIAWGLPLVLALTVPWYLWASIHTEGKFLEVFFWKHNLERGLGSGPMHSHPWYFYGPRLLLDFCPWSLLLIPALYAFLRSSAWRRDPVARLGLVWLAGVMLVLTSSSFKRADYLLPAFPGAALFVASAADRFLRAHQARLRPAYLGLTAICLLSLCSWWYYVDVRLPVAEPQREYRTFATAIRKIAPAPQPIIFFRTESHPLAFHVGRPIDSLLEWENLDIWAGRAGTFFVVMPAHLLTVWPDHLHSGRLVEIARNSSDAQHPHEEPLVLLKTCPNPSPP